ncbi:Crp/Fnr family transcriptional regulator [Chitinophaga sp. 30R24]|uniref:Crp/Fnr family transcriptional regulator n=1 Tax=Chitinophaga sp. 30R24 TaxID=3248838 RepID=UPI003B919FCD
MLRTNPGFTAFMEQYTAEKGITLKVFAPGARMIRQGDTISQAYIIHEGIAKCYISEDNGKDYIFEFLGKGEVTGDLEAIRKDKCLCNVEAITAVTAYSIPHPLFMELVQHNPVFNALLLEELAIRIQQTCRRVSYQQLYPVEYALLRLLALGADQHISLPKKDMAAYLGISLRSFNRTVKELREKDILDKEELNIGLNRKQLMEILRRFEE